MLFSLIRLVFSDSGAMALEYAVLVALVSFFMYWTYAPVFVELSIVFTDIASHIGDNLRLVGGRG